MGRGKGTQNDTGADESVSATTIPVKSMPAIPTAEGIEPNEPVEKSRKPCRVDRCVFPTHAGHVMVELRIPITVEVITALEKY